MLVKKDAEASRRLASRRCPQPQLCSHLRGIDAHRFPGRIQDRHPSNGLLGNVAIHLFFNQTRQPACISLDSPTLPPTRPPRVL